ncbi:MAG: DUF4131 domain-containing protein [Deltaproteobacteria bacterium]|nr:MAG: DUF4131 domain-containing protein [Deltaproteobacteria bacterium]
MGDGIPMAISLASLGVILSLLLVLCRQNKKVGKLLGLALLFTLGALLIHLKLHPTLSPHHIAKIPERKERVLVGTIYRPPQKRGGKVVVYLLVEKIYEGDIFGPSTGKVRITIRDPSLKLRYGYRVRLSAKLYRPRNFRNPGSFDYEGYLRRRGY